MRGFWSSWIETLCTTCWGIMAPAGRRFTGVVCPPFCPWLRVRLRDCGCGTNASVWMSWRTKPICGPSNQPLWQSSANGSRLWRRGCWSDIKGAAPKLAWVCRISLWLRITLNNIATLWMKYGTWCMVFKQWLCCITLGSPLNMFYDNAGIRTLSNKQ